MNAVRLFLLFAFSLYISGCKSEDITNSLITNQSESAKVVSIKAVSIVEPDGTYGPGTVIHIHVEFTQDVVIFSGFPSMALNSGSVAVYNGMYDSKTAIFDYPISANDSSADLNYLSINSISINSAYVQSVADGSDASLVLPDPLSANSIGSKHNVAIDGVAPTAPTVFGVTGGPDSNPDDYLEMHPNPVIHWTDSPDEDSYEIEVFDHTFTSVCFTTVGQDITSVDLSTPCTLQPERMHKVVVTALDSLSNSADSSDFFFMVSPYPINGMHTWLDAMDPDTINLSISDVVAWEDKSPRHNDFSQVTNSLQPDYNTSAFGGKPGIQFDGTDDCLFSAADPGMDSPDLSVVIVFKANYISGVDRPFNLRYSSGAGIYSHTALALDILGGGSPYFRQRGAKLADNSLAFSNMFSPVGGTNIVTISRDASANLTTYINGTLEGNRVGVNGFPSGHMSSSVGCGHNGSSPDSFFEGYVGEVLIYNRKNTLDRCFYIMHRID